MSQVMLKPFNKGDVVRLRKYWFGRGIPARTRVRIIEVSSPWSYRILAPDGQVFQALRDELDP